MNYFTLLISLQDFLNVLTPVILDRLQVSLLILSEFKRINLYSPRNHEKSISFLMISGGVEVISSYKFS